MFNQLNDIDIVSTALILDVAVWSSYFQVPVYLIQAFTLLMVANASINPLIYFLLNKEFRLSAKALFAGSLVRLFANILKYNIILIVIQLSILILTTVQDNIVYCLAR